MIVIAGFVPAIHVLDAYAKQDADARDKRGHEADFLMIRFECHVWTAPAGQVVF